MHRDGGNNWPSEFMISGYYNYIKSFIDFSVGEKPKVLEFACGTGANLRFFDEIGFEVYGIDSSKSAIERCIQRGFKEENFSPVNILQGIEISDIWPNTKFDLIIFLSATAYFDDNDLNILNKKFYNALKNRGAFL